MHACLNVDEIVRLIARELARPGAKADAVALACCRKSFEDPVLDTLWEIQNRLLPLLKSFPEDVWDEGGRPSFKRPPTALEWAHFRKYARRMRTLVECGVPDVLPPKVLSVLQLCPFNKPFFPNLKTLELWRVAEEFIPFITSFLSPRTTVVSISFETFGYCDVAIASTIASFPTLCPNLRDVTLHFLPGDPMITTAVSGILLSDIRNALRRFRVDSLLTEEAREVVYKLPNLRELSVIIESGASSPSVALPNLTTLLIVCENDNDCLRVLQGARFGKLKTVNFHSKSGQIDDFLEAFQRVALATSIQNTLSKFTFSTPRLWNPNYTSLLPFAQLTALTVKFPCADSCSSRVDDDIVMSLARTMQKLKILQLGDSPCREIPIGVTVKGLVALANRCPDLTELHIHFQVASLSALPAIGGMPTTPRKGCALAELDVGRILVPEESVLVVALTLAHIFPHIEYIDHVDENWKKVMDAINLSREIVGYSEATLEGDS